MHLGMCANVADVHRVPWSADCWSLNIPIIFAVLLAWHRAPIPPPHSPKWKQLISIRHRPRFNPEQNELSWSVADRTLRAALGGGVHSAILESAASGESNRPGMGLLRIKLDGSERGDTAQSCLTHASD